MMRRLVTGVTMFAAVTLLYGCGGNQFSDIQQWMEESSKNLHAKVEPLPEVKPYEPFVYSAFDLLSPFSTSKLQVAKRGGANPNAPDTKRIKETLEAYDLEKLRMVGTLGSGKELNALIRSPDGNLYRVRVGSYMGQNFGKVITIAEDKITLKEIVEDSSGDWVEKTTDVPLDETEKK